MKSAPPFLCLVLYLGVLVTVAGCRIEVIRFRESDPLNVEEYEKLQEDKSTLSDSLEKLGAPDEVEYKAGSEEDYLWYLYGDSLNTGLRFLFPPFRAGLYQHTFLRLSAQSEEVNAIELVFDKEGLLKKKRLRLTDAYQKKIEGASDWKLHINPYAGRSFQLVGDAGETEFDKAFENGFRTGLSLGLQPVPVFTLLIGGNYQEYQGSTAFENGRRLNFDDLSLYQFEIGIKLSVPISLLVTFPDYETVKKALFEEDLDKPQGFRLYVQGTTGVTYNERVQVKINGAPAGNFYDSAWGFSSVVEGGVEYDWQWGAAYAGLQYQGVDPFDEGNTALDSEGGAFQAILITGGVTLKF